ncbi:zinc finger, GRF-type [Artemisia annua]|uniref:Zinc finger, GRF-type n=1 Tax=Artemisia annua TaxID=35608 RepID=A0A2U1NQ44_ARTAN|nr:zinc finger, GRF-type [Artemisia annua]
MVLCLCNKQCVIRYSWTPRNPGRCFYCCPQTGGTNCGFFNWYDPPMCARLTEIIPGLLMSRNVLEESVNELQATNRRLKICFC